MSLQFTITDAGRAALVNAQNSGTAAVVISAVAFGTARYTPTAAQTKLTTEVRRVSTVFGDVVADDTIHVVAQDEGTSAYNVGEIGLFTSTGVLFGVYSVPGNAWIIEKSASSTLLLAIDVVLTSLTTASLMFGDTSFVNPPATVNVAGVVELATSAEVAAGTDNIRAVTPKGLADLLATTARAGIVRLSDALNSTSTTMAATASAVKRAYDEATKRLLKTDNLSDLTDPAAARTNLGLTGAVSPVLATNLTAGRAVVSDANGKMAVSPVTATELGYVDGVTSPIQTQLNAKQATMTGAVTTITTEDLTPSRALVSNFNGKVAASEVTIPELKQLIGVNRPVQTQIDELSQFNNPWGVRALNETGYQVLPSGLILQWGISASFGTEREGPQVITFPRPFVTACFNVSATVINMTGNEYNQDQWVQVYGPTLQSFTMYLQHVGGTSYQQNVRCYWFALGV